MTSARIVHVLGTADEGGTGILRLVDALAQGASTRGHESEYWFLGSGGVLLDRLLESGRQAVALGWSGSRYQIHQLVRCAMLLRGRRPDLVCQHSGGRLIRRMTRMLGGRVVLHVHGYVWESRGVEPFTIPGGGGDADAIIANSRATAVQARLSERVHVIYPGADARGARRYRLTTGDADEFVLGAAGRLTEVKGLDVLIRTVASLTAVFPRIRLEIAGSGPEYPNLEAAAHDLGVGDRITFLGWQSDLAPLFARWDLVIQPSRAEGFGMTALEAMAAGVPVIASAVGGLVELIEHERSGWLVPANDVEALAVAIKNALSNPAARHAVGEAGRNRVATSFSTRHMVDATLAVYGDVLAGLAR